MRIVLPRKRCYHCRRSLPLTAFRSMRDPARLVCICTTCRVEHAKATKAYRLSHLEKWEEYTRRHRAAYAADPTRFLASDRKYRQSHKASHAARVKKWRKHNKDKVNKAARLRKKRLPKDCNELITGRLRGRVYSALLSQGVCRRTDVGKLIGCSIDFYKKYLALKWAKGMSWNNYGKWEVDHIRPCALFDLSREEDRLACFHYSNTRPLWKAENMRRRHHSMEVVVKKNADGTRQIFPTCIPKRNHRSRNEPIEYVEE